MPSTERIRSPRAVLAAAVLAAGVVDKAVSEYLLVAITPLSAPIVTPRVLADAVSTAVAALAPLAFVFLACRYAAIRSVPARTVAVVSVLAGIVGRYVGAVVGTVLAGGSPPSPLILATYSDLDVELHEPVLLTIVGFGVLAAGLWPMVGAFGGIGLAGLLADDPAGPHHR